MNIETSKGILKKKSEFKYKRIHFKASKIRRNLALTVLAFPAFIILILFHFVPMPGIVLAFKNYNFADGIFGSRPKTPRLPAASCNSQACSCVSA